MFSEDACLRDVVEETQAIIQRIESLPAHVRPWLRGLEAEAERVWLEVDAIRHRSASKFLTWALAGAEGKEADRQR